MSAVSYTHLDVYKRQEVGIDYDQFISALKEQKGDFEMAREFAVPEKTIKLLKERFYKSDVPITGNYGQD